MKEKAKKKGGKRKGAGRKPSPKKTPVTGYFDDATLSKFGGKEGLRVAFYEFANGVINPAHKGFVIYDAPPLPKTTKDEFDFQDAKKKFPSSDRKVKQKGVPLPDDYVKFSQPAPVLKPKEQPKKTIAHSTTFDSKGRIVEDLKIQQAPVNNFEAAISETAEKAIREQIEAIRAEKIPSERNTPMGKKAWQLDQQKRIQDLQNKLNGI